MPTNFYGIPNSPIWGLLAHQTASFYQLDPATYTVPVEPLADIIPTVTPFRIAVSSIDNENYVQNYRVTRNALQDFTDVTPNVHKELTELTITGVFSSAPNMSLLGIPTSPPTFGFRLDLLQMANLERMADKRKPIMVITPRVCLARAFIQSITRPWQPNDGVNSPVIVQVIEARIASPFSTDVLPDVDGLAPGNSQTTGGGEQAATNVASSTSAPPVAQVPPSTSVGLVPAA